MSRTALPALVAALVVVVAGWAPPASAHVTMTASTTAAGAVARVVVEVPHGCAGSATTGLDVRLPEGVGEAAADTTDRWQGEESGRLVSWTTDAPLPDGLHDEVAFSVRLPDEVGEVLVFPVVQHCDAGEAAWTEVAEDPADVEAQEALDHPAPVIVTTDAAGTDGAQAALADASAPGDGARLAWGAATALGAGLAASGALLLLRRRRA